MRPSWITLYTKSVQHIVRDLGRSTAWTLSRMPPRPIAYPVWSVLNDVWFAVSGSASFTAARQNEASMALRDRPARPVDDCTKKTAVDPYIGVSGPKE